MAQDEEDKYAEDYSKIVVLPGMGGLNAISDEEFIEDNELEDCQNVVYQNGVLTPRQGSYLFANKPTGEIGSPLSLIRLRSSDKTDFLIAKYGGTSGINYYLWDPNNSDWIKINGLYVPYAVLPDGYTSFNNGRGVGNDFGYGGNGTDNTWKWPMSLTTLAAATGSSNSFVDIADGSKFSFEGVLNNTTLLIQDGGTLRSFTATSVSEVISIIDQPANGQTINLFINGNSATVITFVQSLSGAPAGSVLIGMDVPTTITNTLGLLQNPSTTNATQVAFAPADQTLVGYFTYASSGTNIIMTPGGSATTFFGNTNVMGNSVSPTRINISGTVGAVVALGSGITLSMIDKGPAFPAGNVYLSSQKRMFITGGKLSANEIFYSVISNADDFTTTTGITGAGAETVPDGEGPVLNLADFGTFIAIIKQNKISQFTFVYDSSLDAKLVNIIPAAQGQDVGMFAPLSAVAAQNVLYYPTASQGITKLTPTTTGTSFSITSDGSFAEKVLPLCVQTYSFLNGRSIFFEQQLFFSAGIPSVNYTTNPNNVPVKNTDVLVYDMTFEAWTIFKGWGVQDWSNYNTTLLYLSNVDGNIYQCNVGYDDNGQGYLSSAATKKYDMGNPVMPKTVSYVPIRGVINKGGELDIDIVFEMPGGTLTQSFQITSGMVAADGSPLISFPNPIPLGGNTSLGAAVPLGSGVEAEDVTSDDIIKGSFNLWLNVSAAVGFLTAQVVPSSETAGTYWELKVLAFDAEMEAAHPVEYDISPSISN